MDKALFLKIYSILINYGNVAPSSKADKTQAFNLFAISDDCIAKVEPLLPSGWTYTVWPPKDVIKDGLIVKSKPMTTFHLAGKPASAEDISTACGFTA